jgi:formylglycine-generating enzyme required for sulfatase activity
MALPVTHTDFHRFVLATGAPEPWVDEERWQAFDVGYGYPAALRHAWKHGAPSPARATHPVVLVDHTQAEAYCAWWGEQHGGLGSLPTELQWEKAARGDDGRAYPWGDGFDIAAANTLESGRRDTVPVGALPRSASPFGVQDMAGNVFEWTRTRSGERAFVVKGGAWNSDATTARCSARHARPPWLRHVAIGFRCVLQK